MVSRTRFGVLGTGMVGQAIAGKLVALGHEVMMGARRAGGEKAVAWVGGAGPDASEGAFADAARFGTVVVNATAGRASLDALTAAGADDLAGKVLIDVANPIAASVDGPPTLAVCNTDSLGERIQREFPAARVVKALNTVNAEVMVDPALAGDAHTIFVCGDDPQAKAEVVALLRTFGWLPEQVLDLGDITAARGTEMYLMLWLRLWSTLGTGHFNVHVAAPTSRGATSS